MKYYLIAGEASGDLHASRLMAALKDHDAEAEFRFFGGDKMAAVGGTLVRHYRELAYMGFVPVLLHLPTILAGMRQCKRDIRQWRPDVVILVDYPGFNLSIAKFAKQLQASSPAPPHPHTLKYPQVYYYIAPKIWAWKEYRIKRIRRDVDELFSILPFEVEFFEGKHHYPIHYVGNPTADEVRAFLGKDAVAVPCAISAHTPAGSPSPSAMPASRPVIALLAGSRRQEIRDNLPAMIAATEHLADTYDIVLAGAPSMEKSYYEPFVGGRRVTVVYNQTYELLACARAALVTSGTATLETALFNVPQVVCYETPLPRLMGLLRRHLLKVRHVSLVNLIAGREVVTELVADTFSVENIKRELTAILDDGSRRRQEMLQGYRDVQRILGDECAPDNAARLITRLLGV